MAPARPASLKVRALQWLAQREHSRTELRMRLLRLLGRQTDDDAYPPAGATEGMGCDDSPARSNGAESPSDHETAAGAMHRSARPAWRLAGAVHKPASAVALTPEAEVDAVLDWLEQHGYLSDARFAESRVHARQARYGNQRIRQELRQHGIALDDAAQTALAESEFSRALALWQRRYDAPASDPAGRLRQMRFLVGRGFTMPVVQRVLKQAGRLADRSSDDTE
jgi:regulatory protein